MLERAVIIFLCALSGKTIFAIPNLSSSFWQDPIKQLFVLLIQKNLPEQYPYSKNLLRREMITQEVLLLFFLRLSLIYQLLFVMTKSVMVMFTGASTAPQLNTQAVLSSVGSVIVNFVE